MIRSAKGMHKFETVASDGGIGVVNDFYFDDERWAWIADIAWPERSVSVSVTRQSLKNAPPYDRAEHIDRQWELDYYRHLLQPGYWVTGDEARAIKEAQSYLREEPDRIQAGVERRSRPR